MKAITLAVAATLALGTTAFAAGSGPGSANNAPAQEMQQSGSQNPSQYGTTGQDRGNVTGSTSRSGTANSTGANDAGSGASPGAAGMKSGAGSR